MTVRLTARKVFILTLLLMGWAIGLTPAAISAPVFSVEYSVEFSPDMLVFDKIQEYDFVRLQEPGYLNRLGEPMLPMQVIKIALPEGMTVEDIRIADTKYQDISGEFNIFPSQPPIEIGQDEDELVFVEPNEDTYRSSQPYPESAVELIGQSDLAGQSMAEVAIYPVQYTPGNKKLSFLTSITFVLEGSDGYVCGDYLPANCSQETKEVYRRRLQKLVNNKEAIKLVEASAALKLTRSLPSTTPFDHVIITSDANALYYQPLVDWHTKRGLRDTVVTTSFIHSNYSGSDAKERIRNFIIDAHQNWGTMYFLLGGESSTIPFAYREYESTSVPSDSYYGDYDDDWEYEIYIGRMTAEGATQINRFVNKVLKYETDPPLLAYPTNAALLGMDLTISSDPPYYTLTRTENMKEYINENFIPSHFAVTTIYDTQSSNHLDDFKAALNTGQNVVNHSDHSNYSVMCTGDRNHGWCFYSSDIYDLTNYNKFCNIFSLGCYANRMDANDAISEQFIFGVDTTGAVSFTGNTRSGWFYVGDPFSLSSDLDVKWWISLFGYNWYKLGEALAVCKSMSNVHNQFPFSEWTLNLLGEPAMPVWTALPISMYVTHPTDIEALPQDFTVHVEKGGGVNLTDAYVCIWLDGNIYERGTTNSYGDVTFNISPSAVGTMYVTVTRQNYIPYSGEAEVYGNVPPTCYAPDDTVIFQCNPTTISLPVGCSDDDGNLAEGPELVSGRGQIVGGNWQYTPSIEDDSIEVTIRCTDSLDFFCETTFIVYFDFNDSPTCFVPNDTTIMKETPITELSLPVYAEDDDDNLIDGMVINGPGTLSEGYWLYTPTDDEVINVTVQYNDECGAVCESSFNIEYNVHACGDANGDLDINIFDVTYLITYLYLDGPAPDPLLTGNPNGDETINIFDITCLINYLYTGGPPPVCRY